ncbi:MAG: nucleotidyltransferase family protein [Magnetococcales bacterium]|nr:nucleotidyltransferase family protein [Magnetococcales bacterium]
MRAMILAAGKGSRLKEITNDTPKPLVKVAGKPVIERTLSQLAVLGIKEIIINVWYLGDQLIDAIGNGERFGVTIKWSREERLMNTGGGVRQALSLLGDAPFLAVNGDILWDLDLAPILDHFDSQRMDALLGLIPNPDGFKGDFTLTSSGALERTAGAFTYSGIQILSPSALQPFPIEPFSLNSFYDKALLTKRLHGSVLDGRWTDMGTPQRLEMAHREWV